MRRRESGPQHVEPLLEHLLQISCTVSLVPRHRALAAHGLQTLVQRVRYSLIRSGPLCVPTAEHGKGGAAQRHFVAAPRVVEELHKCHRLVWWLPVVSSTEKEAAGSRFEHPRGK